MAVYKSRHECTAGGGKTEWGGAVTPPAGGDGELHSQPGGEQW